MEAFNELLSYDGTAYTPTTHEVIIRDEESLLITASRNKNRDSEWEVRSYCVAGETLKIQTEDIDRAALAAVFIELFDESDLTTSWRQMQSSPVRDGVPVTVAVDGKPAVAAWLYVRGQDRTTVADAMDIGDPTVDEYLSRFRRRGEGIPNPSDCPDVGDIIPDIPPRFDPSGIHEELITDGGVSTVTDSPGAEVTAAGIRFPGSDNLHKQFYDQKEASRERLDVPELKNGDFLQILLDTHSLHLEDGESR